jgi:phosphate transport system protein
MSKHLQVEIDRLHDSLMILCAKVEKRLEEATKAVEEGDRNLARKIVDSDMEIDRLEVDIEEEGLKILALHQPVAVDLRVIVAAIKITNDLERIGDLARNMAKRGLSMKGSASGRLPGVSTMADQVAMQLRLSIDALVQLDVAVAESVIAGDEAIDAMNRDLQERGEAAILKFPDEAHDIMQLVSVARSLERIGDHATNIAEDVIYLVTGDIVRHGKRMNGRRGETQA